MPRDRTKPTLSHTRETYRRLCREIHACRVGRLARQARQWEEILTLHHQERRRFHIIGTTTPTTEGEGGSND